MTLDVVLRVWLVFSLPALAAAPLLRRAFPGLRDGGATIARPAAWLLIAWVSWFLPSIPGVAIYGTPLVITAAAGLVALGAFVGWKDRAIWKELLAREWKTIVIAEALGIAVFALVLWLLKFNGDVHPLAERFMDYAILKRLEHTTSFPPQDSWMAGFTLQYYYYGYVVMDCLRRLAGLTLREFFNPALAGIHAAFAVALFGCGLAIARTRMAGLLAAIGGAFVGNYELFRQVIDWRLKTGHWKFLGLNWFTTSRVIPGTINETPAFASFWGDLHPYLIAFPFVVLCITLAVASLTAERHPLGGDRPRGDRALALALLVIPLGALFPTNSWDFPTFLGLALAALAWPLIDWGALEAARARPREALRSLARPAAVVATIAVLSVLAYIGFHIGFGEQVGRGVRLAQRRSDALPMLIHFGPWLLCILSWAIVTSRGRGMLLRRMLPLPLVILLVLAFELFGRSLLSGVVDAVGGPDAFAGRALEHLFLRGLAFTILVAALWTLLADLEGAAVRTREGISRLLAGAALFVVLVCEFAYVDDFYTGENERMNTIFKAYIQAWILLAVGCAGLLTEAWERLPADLFRSARERAFVLAAAGGFLVLSLATSGPLAEGETRLFVALFAGVVFAGWRCARERRFVGRPVLVAQIAIALVPGITFYALADYNRSGGFQQTRSGNAPTFDPLDLFRRELPHDYEAVAWVERAIDADDVILETTANAYEWESRYATFTGRPTLIGWRNHESGWRNSWELPEARGKLVDEIYAAESLEETWRLCRENGIGWVVVGELERARAKISEGMNAQEVLHSLGQPRGRLRGRGPVVGKPAEGWERWTWGGDASVWVAMPEGRVLHAEQKNATYRLDKFAAADPVYDKGRVRIYRVPGGTSEPTMSKN